MKHHWRSVAFGVGIVVLLLLLWSRVNDRVIAEARAPSGERFVRVREIQLHPVSLGGVLRVNEKVYRCEYYPHPGWPMFSCDTFANESTEIQRAKIEWKNDQSAIVNLDGQFVFECVDGKWSRSNQ